MSPSFLLLQKPVFEETVWRTTPTVVPLIVNSSQPPAVIPNVVSFKDYFETASKTLQKKKKMGTGQGGTFRTGGGQVGIVRQGNQTQPVRYKTLGLQIKLIWHCSDFHHAHISFWSQAHTRKHRRKTFPACLLVFLLKKLQTAKKVTYRVKTVNVHVQKIDSAVQTARG